MIKMKFRPLIFILTLTAIAFGAGVPSQGHSCPMMQQHQNHHAGVNERGDKAMGFSHEKSTHHFILLKNGGVIEVSANRVEDSESLGQIQMHLTHIAKAFAEGDFNLPMFIHDQTPPGVEVMKARKAAIHYQYEKFEQGARVRITTGDKQALAAIHDFLRFQIKDHQTGDSLKISDK
ncbi:MAG: hypothetical protein AB1757_07055 [Acidobacteriota bacterium]